MLDPDGRPPLMKQKAGSVLEMGEASDFEMEHMRQAMVERDGLIQDIFLMLRSVPRFIPSFLFSPKKNAELY